MTYKVQKGDTLSGIAKRYGTTVSAIQKANSSLIKDVNKISVGWSLTIPTINVKDYNAIGKQVEKCLSDIKNLDSYNSLIKLLG